MFRPHMETHTSTPSSNKNMKNEDGEMELPCVALGELR